MVGQVEDEETDSDARERGEPVRAAEKDVVDAVECVPHAAPDEDETDDDEKILREVAERVAKFFAHEDTVYHASKLQNPHFTWYALQCQRKRRCSSVGRARPW